jgi:hypothetical protein
MEAPKCPRCETRHWTQQPCPAEKTAVREKPVPSMDAVLRGALRRSTKVVGRMVPVDEKGEPVCPVCAARKAKHAERVRRWRAKK